MEQSPDLAGTQHPAWPCSFSSTVRGREAEPDSRAGLHGCFSLSFPFPALVSPPTVPEKKTVSDGTHLCRFMQEAIWAVMV